MDISRTPSARKRHAEEASDSPTTVTNLGSEPIPGSLDSNRTETEQSSTTGVDAGRREPSLPDFSGGGAQQDYEGKLNLVPPKTNGSMTVQKEPSFEVGRSESTDLKQESARKEVFQSVPNGEGALSGNDTFAGVGDRSKEVAVEIKKTTETEVSATEETAEHRDGTTELSQAKEVEDTTAMESKEIANDAAPKVADQSKENSTTPDGNVTSTEAKVMNDGAPRLFASPPRSSGSEGKKNLSAKVMNDAPSLLGFQPPNGFFVPQQGPRFNQPQPDFLPPKLTRPPPFGPVVEGMRPPFGQPTDVRWPGYQPVLPQGPDRSGYPPNAVYGPMPPHPRPGSQTAVVYGPDVLDPRLHAEDPYNLEGGGGGYGQPANFPGRLPIVPDPYNVAGQNYPWPAANFPGRPPIGQSDPRAPPASNPNYPSVQSLPVVLPMRLDPSGRPVPNQQQIFYPQPPSQQHQQQQAVKQPPPMMPGSEIQ